MLRVPSSTSPARSLNSRLSQTFDGAEIAVAVLADAHAFGIVAVSAERRRAGGADPFLAALVAALSARRGAGAAFPSSLSRPPHASICFFSSSVRCFSVSFLSHSSGISAVSASLDEIEPLEHVAEDAVEAVEIALVLHQRRARQIVEILDAAAGEVLFHRLHERQDIRATSPARRLASARERRSQTSLWPARLVRIKRNDGALSGSDATKRQL